MSDKKYICCGFRCVSWATNEDNETEIMVQGCPNGMAQAGGAALVRFAGKELQYPYIELDHIAKTYCTNYKDLPEDAKAGVRHRILVDSERMAQAIEANLTMEKLH